MTLAADSSALLAIFRDEPMGRGWLEYLVRRKAGGLECLVCEVVFAEIAPLFSSANEVINALGALGVRFDAIQPSAAFLAGQIYRAYRRSGGPRQTMVPDFLIGSHALCQAEALVTTDRGYLREHFQGLTVVSSLPIP